MKEAMLIKRPLVCPRARNRQTSGFTMPEVVLAMIVFTGCC
jgi:prepilin-type N-terminal cleavage/methylation domain-containing protein